MDLCGCLGNWFFSSALVSPDNFGAIKKVLLKSLLQHYWLALTTVSKVYSKKSSHGKCFNKILLYEESPWIQKAFDKSHGSSFSPETSAVSYFILYKLCSFILLLFAYSFNDPAFPHCLLYSNFGSVPSVGKSIHNLTDSLQYPLERDTADTLAYLHKI